MLQRLMAVGPIWILVQCSGQGVIKKQSCSYSDEWGLRDVLTILLDIRVKDDKEIVVNSFL